MTARGWIRTGTIILTVYHLVLGVWPFLSPRSFYDYFPARGHPWVALLPPYNEHLLRDFGGLNLGLAIVLGSAAAFAERRLTFVALAAAIVVEVPHMIFHTTHLEGFPRADAVMQTIGLSVIMVIPIALLIPAWRLPQQRQR
ncbi:MAG TPA: hypothetical protein VIP11_26095 [Gemmatimonadaceae bacterium]